MQKEHTDYERFESNRTRARGRVRELALCNSWDWFATLTFDKEKQDRYELTAIIKAVGNWVGNFNRRYTCKVRYLLIPEQHRDGAWHMHGLFSGIPAEALSINRYGYYTIADYERRFGFISLSKILDRKRTASYITKYISKDINSTPLKKGEHMFYSSRGLQGRQTLFTTYVPDNFPDHYVNDWCGISWCSAEDLDPFELEQNLKVGINVVRKGG